MTGLPRVGVVEGGAEIGFSGYCTKNNFRPPAREGRPLVADVAEEECVTGNRFAGKGAVGFAGRAGE